MSVEVFHRPGQKAFGPWGNHTSSLDWCEDNYTHSDHIAEFWNTLSNIPFILLGIWGILSTKHLPTRSRYVFAQAFIAIIGFGSALFHGTLLWHAQVMLDELPMIWSGAMALYIAMVGGKEHGSLMLKVAVSIVPFVVSWVYLAFPDPVIHQVAYAGIQVLSFIQVRKLINQLPTKTAAQRFKRSETINNFIKGAATFLLGFAIWNVDNLFCDGLTSLRSGKGELIGMLTQGHAWWHLLTGLGASRIISALIYLTLALRRPDDFEFGYAFGHPYIRRTTTATKKVK